MAWTNLKICLGMLGSTRFLFLHIMLEVLRFCADFRDVVKETTAHVHFQKARSTPYRLEGSRRRDWVATTRCDGPRVHRVGSHSGREGTQTVRVCGIPARRNHG